VRRVAAQLVVTGVHDVGFAPFRGAAVSQAIGKPMRIVFDAIQAKATVPIFGRDLPRPAFILPATINMTPK
jgi:hypothetical protein